MAFKNNPKITSTGTDTLPVMIHELLEANSMSFKKGEFVYSNAGAITNVASAGVVVLGIAAKDATNVTSGNIAIPVTIIKPEYEFIMRITNNGTDTLSSTPTEGKAYGLYVASNVVYADVNNTTNDAVVFQRPVYDATGAATYWGYFRMLATVCQMATGN